MGKNKENVCTDQAHELTPNAVSWLDYFLWLCVWLNLLGQEIKWHATHLNELTSDLRPCWDDRREQTLRGLEERPSEQGKSTQISPRLPCWRRAETKPGIRDEPPHRDGDATSRWRTGPHCWNSSLTDVAVLITRCSSILHFTNWSAQGHPSNLLTNYPPKRKASK